MKTVPEQLRVPMTSFQTDSWPVKIRVRATPLPKAPRKPQIFPARLPLFDETDSARSTIGWRQPGSNRRVSLFRVPMHSWSLEEVAEK
jgi:hypothetical protein